MKRLWRSPALALALTMPWASPSAAAPGDDESPDFGFALVRYNGGNWNPREHGLSRLAWEVRKRTSIAVELRTSAVDPTQDDVFNHPMLVWQGDGAFPPMPNQGVQNIRQHIAMGGTLLIDISDGVEDGPFHRSVVRDLRRAFPEHPLERVPRDHVLYKSFYLLDRHGGRVPTRSYLEGIFLEGRLAVILSTNDLAGAMARNEFGEWDYDVSAGGNTAREMTYRLGVNMVMYALCLDYKEDQVHIPFILQRRR